MSDFSRRFAAFEANRKLRAGRLGDGGSDGPGDLPLHGIGLSLWTLPLWTPTGAATVRVSMGRDRRVTVFASVVETGRGGSASLRALVARDLGIPSEHVKIAPVDTSVVSDSGPSTEAWTQAVVLPLAARCCVNLKRRLAKSGPPLSAQARRRRSPGPTASGQDRKAVPAVIGTVARVRLDPVSGCVRCTGWWCAIDAGTLVDPDRMRTAALAAAQRALDSALWADAVAGGGVVPPSAHRLLRAVELIESTGYAGGVAEGVAAGLPPALGAAVEQAGIRAVHTLPIGSAPLEGEGE
jgi:CO/xanthine dehydrogenase Mo-binding subunit